MSSKLLSPDASFYERKYTVNNFNLSAS